MCTFAFQIFALDRMAKRARPKFAVGGLDADMSDWGVIKSSNSKFDRKRAPVETFEEYDPEKMRLRKGGKLGKSSFKSKARYKRR